MADDDELGLDEGKGRKKTSKTTWLYLGLAAGAFILTYLVYEHSKGSSSSSSNSNSDGTPINPGAEIAVPTAASTYQPGTEMQAYQQGINDALSIVQAQQGTGSESSSTTTPSSSSGSGTSSQTQPVTTTPVTTTPVTTQAPVTTTYAPPSQPVLSQYGGGYAPTNVSNRTYPYQIGGSSYHWVSNPTAAARDISEGEQLYYSPSPGEMVPVTGALPYATPEYVKQ
jgi:hypothetical protein